MAYSVHIKYAHIVIKARVRKTDTPSIKTYTYTVKPVYNDHLCNKIYYL